MASTSQGDSRDVLAGAGKSGSPVPLRRRVLDFRSWSDLFADVDNLRRTGYDRAGNWDLSQVLDHVGEGIRTAVRGSEHRAAWIIRKLLGPMILRRILRDRRMKAGIKVPACWLPGPVHDESGAIDQLRADAAAFARMTTTPFPHPFFGPLTKEKWNDLLLVHASHHLSFLVPRG